MDIPQIGISVLRDIGYSAVFGKRIGQDFKLDIPAGKKGGKFSGEQFGVGTAEEYFALFGEILRMGIDKLKVYSDCDGFSSRLESFSFCSCLGFVGGVVWVKGVLETDRCFCLL